MVLLIGLGIPQFATSQESGTTGARRDTTYSLPGVRVLETSASRRRLAGSVSVVDSATMIGARVFTTSEALRKVPGIYVRDEEGFGLRPNIGVRGLNPTRSTKVLLLEDGIPVMLAPYGDNASYYHPPIDRLETIEVVKGAGQILHGPQTIGGVINYLTPAIPGRPAGLIRVAPGNRGLLNVHARYGGTFGGAGLLLDALRKQGDGSRQNTSSELSDASLKLLVPLSASQTLTLRGNYFAERSRVTYSGLTEAEYAADPLTNPFLNDRMALDRTGLVVSHRLGSSAARQLTTTLYTHAVQRDWWRQSSTSTQRPNDRSDPTCGGMSNLSTTCGNEGRLREYRVAGAETRLSHIRGLWGWESRIDAGARAHFEEQQRLQVNGQAPSARSAGLGTNVNSGMVEDNLRRTQAVSAWVLGAFTKGRLTLSPGARLEQILLSRTNRRPTAAAPSGVSGSTSLTQLIPGAGVSYEVGEALTMFAGVHRGFAPPRPEDIINNTTGGVVELDAELSWNTEVGARSRIGAHGEVSVTAFRMDFSNQIVPASAAGGAGAVLTSAGETRHMGVELAASLRPATRRHIAPFAEVAATLIPVARFEGARFAFRGTGGSDVADKVYLEQNATNSREQIVISGKRLPYAPRVLSTLTIGAAHRAGSDVRLEAVYTGAQFSDPLNTSITVADGQQGVIPAVLIWNVAVNTLIPRSRTTMFATVKNLTDRRYIVDRTRGILPGMPRLVQAGISQPF
jgi:Fe(3+) dicitrate transport protein